MMSGATGAAALLKLVDITPASIGLDAAGFGAIVAEAGFSFYNYKHSSPYRLMTYLQNECSHRGAETFRRFNVG
jgi:hypothetical protein